MPCFIKSIATSFPWSGSSLFEDLQLSWICFKDESDEMQAVAEVWIDCSGGLSIHDIVIKCVFSKFVSVHHSCRRLNGPLVAKVPKALLICQVLDVNLFELGCVHYHFIVDRLGRGRLGIVIWDHVEVKDLFPWVSDDLSVDDRTSHWVID